MKKVLVLFLVFCFSYSSIYSQADGETPRAFLERLSQVYANIKTMQTRITISRSGRSESGLLSYQAPSKLRIDFRNPEDQILLITETLFQLYVPRYEMIMEQKLRADEATQATGIASSQGLKLLIDNYTVSYANGDNGLQPLVSGSGVMVYKLKLDWKNYTEGFRELEISVNKSMQIVRVVGLTPLFETIEFDYSNISVNPDLSDVVWELEIEGMNKVNTYPDFLKPVE